MFDLNAFPQDLFAVGRGFPLVHTDLKSSPWISMNRVYFRNGLTTFMTQDASKGPLVLARAPVGPDQKWVVINKVGGLFGQTIAVSQGAASAVEKLNEQTWPANSEAR